VDKMNFPGFIFYDHLDSFGHDVCRREESMDFVSSFAMENPDIECFNTLGYTKEKFVSLEANDFISHHHHGLYVKESVNDIRLTIKIKVIQDGDTFGPWSGGRYEHFLFVNEEPDFWVIIGSPGVEKFDELRTIVFNPNEDFKETASLCFWSQG